MEKLHINLENENLRPQLDWIIDNASATDFNYPPVILNYLHAILCLHNSITSLFIFKEFWSYTAILWKDKGIQQCFERSNEYQLIDCAK